MLTLAHGCSCDVCAEEYGPHRPPHSIPCGHVLCASCCTTIIDKTPSRLVPSCPFCRVQFTADQMRMIRMDFTTSGWTTPRRFPTVEASPITSDLLARRTERLLSSTDGMSRARLDARRLEAKVAKVAAKKCSVEEVSALHKEIGDWLLAEKDDQTASLYLSAALLRAILVNHTAHSEASKAAKSSENSLKNKIDELERTNDKLDTDLRRQRNQYNAKSQECLQLRSEISQLKALASTLGVPQSEMPTPTPQSATPPPMSPTSPTPYSASQTPVSRFHSRSASMSSRPTTPAAPLSPSRSHTPGLASPTRTSSASAAAARPPTPAHGLRTYTPVPAPPPPMPSLPRQYAATPSPMQMRHQAYTPAPLIPPKPRRLSHSSPPKMARSMSEEKALAHERWLPPEFQDEKTTKASTPRPPSRMQGFSSAAYAAARIRDMHVAST